jgi:membrane fusion protein (multidrug efflux system)
MADERTPAQSGTKTEEPRFSPNGNGNGKTGDGQGQTKYAPPKAEEEKGGGDPAAGKPKANPRKTLMIGLIVFIAAIFAIIWGVRYLHYSQTHVGTDDAYSTGNLVNVSPIISGTLSTLTVDEGDTVKQGQLIGRIEDSGPLAAVRQAQAAYDAAETQIPQARTSLLYEQQATDAAIRKAQSELAAQNAKTAGAKQQVALSTATVRNQVAQAESQVLQAQAQAASAQAQVKTAQAAVQAQQQNVQTAQRAADAAAADISAAKANADKASRDRKRYAVLVGQEAVTQQQFDAADAASVSAQSQLESTSQQAAQARSQVAADQADVRQAYAQLKAAQRNAEAVGQQVEVARAGLNLAKANLIQVPIQQTNVANNLQQGGSAEADLSTAQAGKQQIALKQQEIATYQAQALQAKAALQNAKVTEDDTYIYAPTDGQVVRKAVNVGASLSPGQTIVTLTVGNDVWVTANFKETQLTDVRVGQPAEVEVDQIPGKIFKGQVQAIEQATGASTALLPPDNATGNFTKVVQRVPVRIKLIAASDTEDPKYARLADIQHLGQGLSVNAVIDTSNVHK